MNMTSQSHRTAADEEVAQRFAESFSVVSLYETSAPPAVKSGCT
jgi:hypothetical protein